MASLIPALSEKAKEEIERNVPYELRALDSIEAFQDLFDLEKHPITWEQLFDFCENHPCMSVNDFYAHGTEFLYRKNGDDGFLKLGSIHFNYYFDRKMIEGTIMDTIKRIATVTGMDIFIIIGDIHGWWEKPQTY